MRVLAAFFLSSVALLAQVVPGRYVVELSNPPLGVLARAGNRSAPATARRGRINAEQRSALLWLEQRKGRVVSSLTGIMNALVIDLPDANPAALSSMPGAGRVYTVRMAYPVLDRALPLHSVPQAWAAVGGADKAGAGIKIAILDTGISASHPGFQDPSLAIPPGYPLVSRPENKALTNNKIIVARDYAQFYSLTNQPDTAADRYGHGTATTMCAAGVPTQSPLGRITGVAPKAWIGVYKITSLNGGAASNDAIAKALDDALADGMDIINISFDSPFVLPLDQDLVSTSIQRASELGMIVVVSAGNAGPDLATIEDLGSIPSAISVGASDSDRTLGAGVTVPGAGPYLAFTSTAAPPDQPISAPLLDLNQIAPGGTPCNPLPAGSAARHILMAQSGTCLFETQINNAAAAGAAALILSPLSPQQNAARIGAGQAKLPAVMIGFEDASAIRTALDPAREVTAKISFSGVAFPLDPMALFGFSSRGPTYSNLIKPDLSATGYVYTAAQSIDPQGAIYSANGYVTASGTSFSAPIVAGAAAVLKAARPGLTVDQYRSLLINSARPMLMAAGAVERVQRTGAGVLDLAAALNGTVAAFPTSLSFGAGAGNLNGLNQLTLTNVGRKADTFTIDATAYDDAPPMLFSPDPGGAGAARLVTLNIAPGQSRTVYAIWRFAGLRPGEYQGLIAVQGSADTRAAFVPYWHAIPTGTPAAATLLNGAPTQYPAGRSFTVYFRVVDSTGIAVLDTEALHFLGSVVSGGGSVGTLTFSDSYPNVVYTILTLGPDPGPNIFRVSFGNLPPRTFGITGTRQ